VKVRIGYGLGTSTTLNDSRYGEVVDALEDQGWDSLWVSERISGSAPDPTVALAYATARTSRLKFGMSVMVLPGRNPVIVATQLASIDRLSGGRLLPAFGLGIANPHEQQAFGVTREERAPWFNEALPLLRRFWTEASVDHDGPRFHYRDMRVEPKPHQQPMDIWLGGIAPSELRRVGRLADGWLPSFIRPIEAAEARGAVEAAAAESDRTIDPEHFGALIPYTMSAIPEANLAALRARRPDVDPADIIPVGFDALAEQITAFTASGFSKFVVIPLAEPNDWVDHLASAANALLPLQKSLSSA
jgi:probable F420-dependent oxidoreductase